jgi:flagellin-like hook-associated protein FlgL
MVIQTNVQTATGANAGTSVHAKPNRKGTPADDRPPSDRDEVAILPRGTNRLSSTFPPISDSHGAEEVTEFLRHHILTRPAASISVQANSRPQAVFELLDGIFES